MLFQNALLEAWAVLLSNFSQTELVKKDWNATPASAKHKMSWTTSKGQLTHDNEDSSGGESIGVAEELMMMMMMMMMMVDWTGQQSISTSTIVDALCVFFLSMLAGWGTCPKALPNFF